MNTEVEYKRVNLLRTNFERRYGYLFSAMLNKQWRAVANRITENNYRDPDVVTEVSRKDTEKVFVAMYETVGVAFARESYNNIKARSDEEVIDRWVEYMRRYARTEAGSRITSITNITRDQISETVGNAVRQATDDGLGSAQTARLIRSALRQQGEAINTWRALRIARTEVMTASNAGSLQGAKDLGVPMDKIWIATMDQRTRDSHAMMNNVAVDINEKFRLPSGAIMDGPGDPAGGASEVVNCRCTVAHRVKRTGVTRGGAGEGLTVEQPQMPVMPQERVEFKPAATIKDAEDWAMANIANGTVSYKNIPIEYVNDVNLTILNLEKQYGKKFTKIGTRANMTVDDNLMEVSHYRTQILEGGRAIGYEDRVDLRINTKFFNHPRHKEILKAQYEGGWSYSENVTDLVTHEYGHVLTKYPTGGTELAQFGGVKVDIPTLSKYGQGSMSEAVAEVFLKAKKWGLDRLTAEELKILMKYIDY